MRRTFTLRRLFVNITVLCVVLAATQAFPDESLRVVLFLGLYLPAAAAIGFFTYISPLRGATFAAGFFGAFVGRLLSPSVSGRSSTWMDQFSNDFATTAGPIGIGAFLFSLIGWAIAVRLTRRA